MYTCALPFIYTNKYACTYTKTYIYTCFSVYRHSMRPRTHTVHQSIHTHVTCDDPTRTYIHAVAPSHIHAYIPTYIHTYIRTYAHTYIHAYIPTCLPTYIHARMRYMHMQTRKYKNTYIHICLYINTYVYLCMYVCMYVCMYICMCVCEHIYYICVFAIST